MVHLLEFHGRVIRADGRPANPGPTDLQVALHPAREGDHVLWQDTLPSVEVAPGGFFHVLLGETEPIDQALFDGAPRWVSVRVSRSGKPGEEVSERVPVLGTTVRLGRELDDIQARLGTVEAAAGAVPERKNERRLRRRTSLLHQRLKRIEEGGGPLDALQARVVAVERHLETLDGEEGRLARVEDEIEDIVGPDGDIIDLLERVERLEGRGPVPERGPIPTLTPTSKLTPHVLERIDQFDTRLNTIETRPAPPLPSAEALHVVKKGGDVMTGGLTINRGGLDVLSGGIKCRGADVNSLEATLFVKAAKLIGDALEVRGDITVDSTKRTLQIRHIEGRAGSGRKDGALVLNGRSGAAVEVGNAEAESDGLLVHGVTRSVALQSPGTAVAVAFQSGGDFQVGEVVGVNDTGHLIHLREAYDPRAFGIVTDAAAVALGVGGERRILVAVAGVTRCRVDTTGGPVHAGDLLVASGERGFARRADDRERAFGAVIGKAMAALAEGKGELSVLVASR
jgi:hypothetical protein